MPKISYAALDDYYSSQPFDSSANYGFDLANPESDATPQDAFNRFQQAAFHFANADRDEEQLAKAQKHFGKLMLNPNAKDTAYWMGKAIINYSGYPDIFSYYQAADIPIPADAADEAELISTLGENYINSHRAHYDKVKSQRAEHVAEVSKNFQGLLNGTIKPTSLSPQQVADITELCGATPHDIALAGKADRELADKIVKAREAQTLGNQVTSAIGTAATGVSEGLQRVVESAGQVGRGNFSQAARILFKGGTPSSELYNEQFENMQEAWTHPLTSNSKFMKLAKNPAYVQAVASDLYMQRQEALMKDLGAVGRIAYNFNENALSPVVRGAQMVGMGIVDPVLGTTPNRQDLMQASQMDVALDDARLQAYENIKKDGHGSIVEEGFAAASAVAPYMNSYTAVLSSLDLFTKNAGRGFNAIADDNGVADPALFNEASFKAAASSGISWATRAVGSGMFNKAAAKIAPKLLNSTAGYYASNAAFTAANFAFAVPFEEAVLNHMYDSLFVSDLRLATGGRQYNELCENLKTPRYYAVQTVVGGLLAGSSTYTHYNTKTSRESLITWGKLQGLSDREANAIVAGNNLADAPRAIIDKVKDKITNNPEQALKDKVKNIEDFLGEEDTKAARALARAVMADKARLATLQLNGIGVEVDPADPSQVLISEGGHFDEATQAFKPGEKVTRMKMEDAEIYLASVFAEKEAITARAVRQSLANQKMLDAAKKIFGDRLSIEAIADPVSLDKIVERGKEAEKLIAERTRALMEQTADKDGKPALSEPEAAKRAAAEVHSNLHEHSTLAELVKFGKNAEQRIIQAKEQLGKDADGIRFDSNTYVITPRNYTKGQVSRILKIAQGASAREIAEEFAHMYLDDYIANTGSDYADAWRVLNALQSSVQGDKSIKLTSLERDFPELAAKLTGDNPASFDSLTALEKDIVRQEAQESFATLTLSDLRYRAQQGEVSLPDWSRPLFDADLVMRSAMQNELAVAAALDASRDLGLFGENAQRLLRASADAITAALSEAKKPDTSHFYNAYHRASQFFAKAIDSPITAEDIASIEASWDNPATTAPTDHGAEHTPNYNPAITKAIEEAVAEAQADPANAGKSVDELTNEAAQKALDREEQKISERPDASPQPGDSSINSVEIQDDSTLLCRSAVLPIANLKLLPNFKIGSDKDTGEVDKLTGPYKADHPPIMVMHDAADNSFTVISGRHRLAHAKRNGITKIACYIYEKTPEHDIAWAQARDVEWNIMDNQATPLEIALYIRGELIPGMSALTPDQLSRDSIFAREGKQTEHGFLLGTQGTDNLITALRNGAVTVPFAVAVCKAFPSDSYLQGKALSYKLNDSSLSTSGVIDKTYIEKDRLEWQQEQGVYFQRDFFNEITDPSDDTLAQFVESYTLNKRKQLNRLIAAGKLSNDIYSDPSVAAEAAKYGVRVDRALKKRSENLKNKPADPRVELMLWSHPWRNMDIFGAEIDAAFKEAHPKEWQTLQDRKAEQAAEIVEETPDLGNTVQGDVSDIPTLFSVSAAHLESWQRVPFSELGELGTYGKNIERKHQPIGIDYYDERLARAQTAIKRRYAELMHNVSHLDKKDPADAAIIHAELQAIFNQAVQLLPHGYRFSLEPYHIFSTTYANLFGHGDPNKAPSNIPMTGWPRKMRQSFHNIFDRLMTDTSYSEEVSAFHDLFNDFYFWGEIGSLQAEYQQAMADAKAGVDEEYQGKARNTDEYKDALAQARSDAFTAFTIENADIVDAVYRAIGEMRAHRLMDKFLARVILKFDQYRKDRTLARIMKAISRITPRTTKDGKPIKGTVSPEVYNKVLDNYRLMLLTKSEKDIFEADNPELATTENPDAEFKLTTYDKDGKEIKLEKITKQQYETYAGFETMTPEHADDAARALGTLIKHGREAWKIAEEQQKKALHDFVTPAFDKYKATEPEKKKNKEKSALKHDKGQSRIANMFADWFNDGDIMDIIQSHPGLESYRQIHDRIARAHTYLQQAESINQQYAYQALEDAVGTSDRKKIKQWLDHINTNKACNIVLTHQDPDFAAKHTATLRSSLIKRIFSYTRRKNFSANKFAAAIHYLLTSNTLPKEIAAEIKAKYGTIGNHENYGNKAVIAFNELLSADKYGHLRDFNSTVKTRTEASLEKYRASLKEKGVKEEDRTTLIDNISPNQAAFRILTAEQSDYTEMMRLQGYTPEVLQQLREIAGEDMMQFSYALRERMNARTPELKAIYEATYGVPFPQVENYFRAFFNASTEQMQDGLLNGHSYGQKSDDAIKIFRTRIKHNAPIDSTMSVTAAYAIGMAQQDNIIAYSDSKTHQHLATFLRSALNQRQHNETYAQLLERALGKHLYAALKRQIDNTMRLYGSTDAESGYFTKDISDLGKASAYALLNARASSLFKNALAAFNTLGGSDKVSAKAWFKGIVKAFAGKTRMTADEIMKEPFIRERFKGWTFDADKEAFLALTDQKVAHGATDAGLRAGITAFGKVDQYFTKYAAAALYDTHYTALQKENPDLTHEQLHAESLLAVEKALGMKGQPMHWRQRPLDNSKTNWRTMGMYFLGGESFNTFANCMRLFAKANLYRKTEGWTSKTKRAYGNLIAAWLTQGATMSLMNWAYYAITDDEEHWKKRTFFSHMLFGTLIGPAAGMPFVSEILAGMAKGVARLLGYRNMPYISTSGMLPMGDLERSIGDISKIWQSNQSFMDKAIASNNIARLVFTGMLYANTRAGSKSGAIAKGVALGGTMVSNIIDFLLRTARAADERFLD